MRDIVRLKTERELVRIIIDDGNAFWKEIRVNAGVLKLMMLSLKLNAAKIKLVNIVRLNLMLPVQVNVVEEKPKESNGFEEIIDFLNASFVQYALTVNPTIYTTCIEQFCTSAKVKTVYGERQIQALVDKKKVIISETSIRSDLQFDNAKGTDCLPTATIFAELERMGYENLTQKLTFYKSYFSSQWKFLIHTILQCLSAKTISWNNFSSIMAFAIIYSATPTDSHSTPIITQPSSSKPQKKKSRRKKRKDSAPTEPTTEETTPEEHVSNPSYDPPPSGEDRMQLAKLMSLCTNLQEKVLDLEKAKTTQANEITSLKKRVKQLEKRRKLIISRLKRLRKVGSSSRVESSNDASLGAQEDASKQGKKIKDLDADAEITLVNETQEMNDDNLIFDISVLEEQEIKFEKVVE
ncbi:hypothetical protein Tco_0884419 [Tanacetum coccineum]